MSLRIYYYKEVVSGGVFLFCSFDELRRKEVIDVRTGERMGFIDDIEVSVADGRVKKLIIYGGSRLFGLLGKEDDVIIHCSDITVVGREVILIDRTRNVAGTDLPKNQ